VTEYASTGHLDGDIAVDQYLQRVLDVLDQLERGEPVDARSLHQQLVTFLRDTGFSVADPQAWRTSAYALAAWTDELLLETPWDGRHDWNERVLEVELYGTRVSSERFFQLAQEVASRPQHPSLRVFYLCVLLGYRGIYARGDAATAAAFGLPATLSQWMIETRSRLRMHQAMPLPSVPYRQVKGAPPLDDRRRLVWWSIAAAALVAANVTTYSLFH